MHTQSWAVLVNAAYSTHTQSWAVSGHLHPENLTNTCTCTFQSNSVFVPVISTNQSNSVFVLWLVLTKVILFLYLWLILTKVILFFSGHEKALVLQLPNHFITQMCVLPRPETSIQNMNHQSCQLSINWSTKCILSLFLKQVSSKSITNQINH